MLRRILFWLLHWCRLPDRGHLYCSGQPAAFQSINFNLSNTWTKKQKAICKPNNVLFSHFGCQWQIERTLHWCIWCIGHYCKKWKVKAVSYRIIIICITHNICFISLEMNKILNITFGQCGIAFQGLTSADKNETNQILLLLLLSLFCFQTNLKGYYY